MAQAIDELLRAYADAEDDPERAGLADEVVAHFVATADGPGFSSVFGELDPAEAIAAVTRAARTGADILPTMPALLGLLDKRERADIYLASSDFAPIVRAFVEPGAERIAPMLSAIGERDGGVDLFVDLLETAVEAGMDPAPWLPALARKMNDLPERCSGLYAVRELAAAGLDLSSIREELKPLLADGSTRVLTASAIAFSDTRRGYWHGVDELLEHDSAKVRWGAVRALSEMLPRGGESEAVTAMVDRLGPMTADPDREVRKQAREGLREARLAGRLPIPSASGLAAIVERLGRSAEVDELVHDLIIRDREVAAQVREWADPSHRQILQTCDDVVGGRAAPPCEICAGLESFECAGREEDLPAAAHKLVPPDAEIRSCPDCGTRYSYAWSELYDDEFGSHGTYNVRRLAPEPGSRSRDQLRKNAAQPSKRLQEEAVPELARDLFADGAWDELRELLTDNRAVTRARAFMALQEQTEVDGLLPLLRDALADEEEDVRFSAAKMLARRSIRDRDYDDLRSLLGFENDTVRWSTNWALSEAAKERDFDLTPIQPAIEAVCHDADTLARQSALSALKLVASSADLMRTLRSMLDAADSEAREEAVTELGNLAFSAKLYPLEERDREIWNGIAATVPALNESLLAGGSGHGWQILRTLETFQEGGGDLTAAMTGVAAELGRDESRVAVNIFETQVERGLDLAAAMAELERLVAGRSLDTFLDPVVGVLVRHIERSGLSIDGLLQHPRKRVREAARAAAATNEEES